ncbi:MAG: pilus assembly protein PilP [Neptuniibacter sp.]
MYKIILLAMAVMLSGCVDWVDDTQDLVAFVNKAKAKPHGKIEPLPEFEPYHSFVYEGAAMREPFVELVAEEPRTEDELADSGESKLQPDLTRKKTYLESFALDQLKMVGTIYKKQDDRLWALIQDTNQEVHRVSQGDYMGLDYGQIITMDEQTIVVSEIVANGRGGWMKRSRNLVLSEQE